MAQPPTVTGLSNDDQTSRQAPDATIRKLIAIDQDFAKDLALEAVREIEVSDMTDYSLMSIMLESPETMARHSSRTLCFPGHH